MTNKKFEQFTEDLFNIYLELNPAEGVNIGLHEYDGRLGNISKEEITKTIETYKNLRETLISIKREELSGENKLDYDISLWGIESELFSIEEMQGYKFNPMNYASIFSGIDNYVSRDYAPFDERLKSIIEIINKVPETLAVAEENLSQTLPKILCKYAKQFSEGYDNFFRNELLNVIKEKTKNESLISQYTEACKPAVDAFKKYIAVLETRESDDDNSYRLGKVKFEKMLKVKEHIDMSTDELKKIGFDELKRLQDELNKLLKENNFEGKINTLEHSHPSEESLIKDTENTLDELINFIRTKNIVELPEELNCIVTEMPDYMGFGFAAMGTAGPFEKSNESFYYVNLPQKEWDEKKKEEWLTQFNYPTLNLISIHEAYPGHYTHFLNSNKYSTKLSKIFMSYSYIEGWAHYTEEMMIEQGYGDDDFKNKIGMLLEALIRCCRFIAAIGIHCENMSIEEAKNFFMKNAYMPETTAMQEAERGAFDPGYLNYTLGKIFLKRFRDKYFGHYKEKKSLKDFHNEIVRLGAPTYRIAEEYVFGN